MERPTKKARLFDESDSEEGGVAITHAVDQSHLAVNAEYSNRFEHNKKREERQRLEEKFGRPTKLSTNGEDEDESGPSTSEEEDDEGELATAALDVEISATLRAIRSRDPRVYDKNASFYSVEVVGGAQTKDITNQRPMHLRDYHRKNILEGYTGVDDNENAELAQAPRSYAQEQEALKDSILKEMHEAAGTAGGNEDEEDDFLVAVPKTTQDVAVPSQNPLPNVEAADNDPEAFLTSFMTSRAWVPTGGRTLQPLESDDSDEDARAEAFEEAYNLRFEDPEEANKTVRAYSRAAVQKHSVRRDELSSRQKAREREKERKEQVRESELQEKARLKTLIVDEMQAKAEKIREAANLRGEDFHIEAWVDLLNEDWDDNKWEDVTRNRFGDAYYAQRDESGDAPEDAQGDNRLKRPKWDDDIDITDIVPGFDNDEIKAAFSLSDNEYDAEDGSEVDGIEVDGSEVNGADVDRSTTGNSQDHETKQTQRDRKSHAAEMKRIARRDHRILSTAADKRLAADATVAVSSNLAKRSSGPSFRYRDTSPASWGLTPHEILTPTDAQLNGLVGLKKLYPFRDQQKKAKDKKRLLSKKGRLREWRKETFGNRGGPVAAKHDEQVRSAKNGQKKKRRRPLRKAPTS